MRKSNGLAEPVGIYLERIAGQALAHPKCRAWRLTKTWSTVVGDSLAVHTEPSQLSQGVLTIRVDSPVWMHQLLFLKEELLEKLRELWPGESITEIRLRPGPLQKEREKQAINHRPPMIPIHPEDRHRAMALTAEIADEPLRHAVQRFLENQMTRHRVK